MKKIVIIPNVNKDGVLSLSKQVAEIISENGAQAFTDERYGKEYENLFSTYKEFPSDAELIIVIGGDGSVIDASVLAVKYDIPILGINLGNLGYLAEIEPESISALNKIFSGEYTIEEKMLLYSEKIFSDKSKAKASRLAVNDVIISHESYLGVAEFMLITNDNENVKYRADGIIFSTPAGSTAYSLSAGGPVVDHGIDAILVTPICPHSFFNRSIIFNENSRLLIKNTGKSTLKISLDGRLFDVLEIGEACLISKSDKKLKMLAFNENNMFSTLFSKMKKIENM